MHQVAFPHVVLNVVRNTDPARRILDAAIGQGLHADFRDTVTVAR